MKNPKSNAHVSLKLHNLEMCRAFEYSRDVEILSSFEALVIMCEEEKG